MAEAIHMHEDNWGLRILYPAAAQAEATAELEAGRRASEENRDPADAYFAAHGAEQTEIGRRIDRTE